MSRRFGGHHGSKQPNYDGSGIQGQAPTKWAASPAPFATQLGFDPVLLARLAPPERRALDALAQGWTLSCCVLALPVAVLALRIEHSLGLAALGGFATFALSMNLLRLLIAGGGAAPHQRAAGAYRPALQPTLLIGAFALLLSQPAQLAVETPAMHAAITAHRTALQDARRTLGTQLGSPRSDDDAFGRELAQCEFVALRLQLLWQTPQRALALTLGYLLLVLVPALLSQTLWLGALQAYERARFQRSLQTIVHAELHCRAQVRTALQPFTGRAQAGEGGER